MDAVDGFCEGIAFSPAEMRRVFDQARSLGLPVKLHAEQRIQPRRGEAGRVLRRAVRRSPGVSGRGGCRGARAVGDGRGAAARVRSTRCGSNGTPPVVALREAGVRMAVATDCNPGTSPLTSLLLAMNMAATLFGLTVEECLAGTTREAARALGLLG